MSTETVADLSDFPRPTYQNDGQAAFDSVEIANIPEPVMNATATSASETEFTETSKAASAPADAISVIEIVELQQALQQMTASIESLQSAFDSKIRYDTSKQQTIDTLHEELQLHRESLHFRLLRPIFLDLIDMYNDLGKLLKHSDVVAERNENETRLLRNLESFQDTVEEVLYRNGVETYIEESERFKAQRQRVLKTVETDNPDLDGVIAERVRKGFAYEDRILRPETVTIYKLVKRAQQE